MSEIGIQTLEGKFYSLKDAANNVEIGQIVRFNGLLQVVRSRSSYSSYAAVDLVTIDEFIKNRSYWESDPDSTITLLNGGDED